MIEWYESLVRSLKKKNTNEDLTAFRYILQIIKNIIEDGKCLTQDHLFGMMEHIDCNKEMGIGDLTYSLI